jgi:hypothetical protein
MQNLISYLLIFTKSSLSFMRALILFLLINLCASTAYPQLKRLAVIGSSTAFGQGASPIDSSWVRKINYRYKYQQAVVDTVVNLALGGYDPYHALPAWYTPAQYYQCLIRNGILQRQTVLVPMSLL